MSKKPEQLTDLELIADAIGYHAGRNRCGYFPNEWDAQASAWLNTPRGIETLRRMKQVEQVQEVTPLEDTYSPLPLAEALKLPYLQDLTARVDENEVVWEREYREKDGHLDGCTRCQNGLHWQCHGCSCPCSYPEEWRMGRATYDEWVEKVRAIGPYPSYKTEEEMGWPPG